MSANYVALALVSLQLTAAAVSADQVRGVVRQVDARRHELTINARGRGMRGLSMTFTLGSDARVLRGRQPVDLQDLQPGQRVWVSFEVQDATRRAVEIEVRDAGRPGSAKAVEDGQVVGTLARVGYPEREITVIGPALDGQGDSEITLTVPKSARIRRARKTVMFDDLKEGEHVVVQIDQRAAKAAAIAIEVGDSPGPATDFDRRIERIRQILKLADRVLEKMSSGE